MPSLPEGISTAQANAPPAALAGGAFRARAVLGPSVSAAARKNSPASTSCSIFNSRSLWRTRRQPSTGMAAGNTRGRSPHQQLGRSGAGGRGIHLLLLVYLSLHLRLKELGRMIAVIWQDFKGLVWRPRESLEAILTRHSALVSLLLGTLAYYLSTLQLSEILSPSYLGEMTYFLVNFPLAFGRMACTTFLIHLAYRVIVRNQGEWWDLLSMWGYTQVPTIFLAALALVFLVTAPLASRAGAGILWWFSVIGIAFFLS